MMLHAPFAFLLAAALATAGSAAAENAETSREKSSPDASPVPQPTESGARAKAADALLDQLAAAKDPQVQKRLAAAVQALWRRSGSDTVDLLTARSLEAQRASRTDVALRLMDEAVALKPDYAEGWNRRAGLHYAAKDYDGAMVDIRETLTLEPRHYGAWLTLGRILQDSDLDAKALAAFRRALAIYPGVEGLKKEVDDLALKVEGQPI